MLNVAILDDYVGLAMESADWVSLAGVAQFTTFRDHLGEDEAANVLQPFDVLCTMRERMSLPRTLIERLPNLKLILVVGAGIPNLDMAAAAEHGVLVCHSDPDNAAVKTAASSTPELTWGLLIATARRLPQEHGRVRQGLWQGAVGERLGGRTLALLGLGRIGKFMARYGRAFDMPVIAWSQNLTAEAAAAEGVVRVDKDELFARADVLSIHVRLSDRTRGLVGARELGLMKSSAFLINSARGPIVDELALISALQEHRLAGAGLDVFDHEPLPLDHPFRSMNNVIALPHVGYNTRDTLKAFYGDMPEAIAAFASGSPIRLLNPPS